MLVYMLILAGLLYAVGVYWEIRFWRSLGRLARRFLAP